MLISLSNFAQAPTLGTAANFVLFSSNGSVSHTGLSQLTGDVGTNSGASTNFGNVNGNMHDQNPASAQASTDLLTAYNQLAAVTANFFVASPLGNGDTLVAGVYSLGAASTLNGVLTLNAQNNSSAVFIIRVMGSLSSAANTKVNLINGAQACRVYWQIEGLLSIASGTVLRGTFIVNNAAISMSTNDTVEGRLLTTTGAITVNNLMAYTPIGCGSPTLTGPSAPAMGRVGCFGVFSSVGDVTNAGVSFITGDVGTQIGSTTGFDTLNITGKLHLVQDTTTAAANLALGVAFTALNTLSHDIQLMAPAAFGNNLVLTPHTYLLNAMTVLTDSLYLNAMGDSNAVFVIKINGALSTSTYAKVILKNEARSKNVYWLVNGAVAINDYSDFKGTILANNGAVNAKIGVQLQGRLLTTAGAITTAAVTVVSPVVCLAQVAVVITNEPVGSQVCTGDTATFVVQASGNNLSYQWYKNNVLLVNGGSISGVTNDTLTILPAISANAGNYIVIVSDANLADTSAIAALTIRPNTLITSEPSSSLVCSGDSVIFSVVAQGSGLSYQWYRGSTALVNSFFILGADSSALTFFSAVPAQVDSNYYVVVTGSCGPADTSVMVSMRINAVPQLATQPLNQNVCNGDTVRFSITTTSSAQVQWYKGSTLLTNGSNVGGANSTVMTIFAAGFGDTATNYFAVVRGTCGTPDTSDFAALTLKSTTAITTEPAAQTVCAGQAVNFSVAAAGSGLSYQWRIGSTPLLNAGTISGANTATLSISGANLTNAASNYNVIVSGQCGVPDTSVFVTLVVNTAPLITTQPTLQLACVGANASFTVMASGTALSYQWRKGLVNLANSTSISGATSATLSLTGVSLADVATNYNVLISGSCSPAVTSVDVALQVNSLVQITSSPLASQTVCAGGNIAFTVAATGTSLTYQWRKGTVNLINAGNISGATSATLFINPVITSDAGSDYNVVVSGACAPQQISANAILAVNALSVFVNQPVSIRVCEGSSALLTATATGTGLSFQWFKGNTALVDGGNLSGSTSNTLLINPVGLSDAAANYQLVVTGSCLPILSSNLVAIDVALAHLIVAQPADTITHIGGSASFTVVDNGQALGYQWRRGSTLVVDGGNISGSQSATLQFSPATVADNGMNYNVVISGDCAPDLRSINVALLVTQPIGLDELSAENSPVLFYPNPFSYELNAVIQSTSALRMADLYVFNSLGVMVLQYQLTAEQAMHETLVLPAGLYQYRVISEGQLVQTGKLIAIQ